jgi:hypothetical protein
VGKGRFKGIFTLPELEMRTSALVQENMLLKSQVNALQAKHDLVSRTIKIFGFQIQYKRLPSPESKSDILAAIKSAVQAISLEQGTHPQSNGQCSQPRNDCSPGCLG